MKKETQQKERDSINMLRSPREGLGTQIDNNTNN